MHTNLPQTPFSFTEEVFGAEDSDARRIRSERGHVEVFVQRYGNDDHVFESVDVHGFGARGQEAPVGDVHTFSDGLGNWLTFNVGSHVNVYLTQNQARSLAEQLAEALDLRVESAHPSFT